MYITLSCPNTIDTFVQGSSNSNALNTVDTWALIDCQDPSYLYQGNPIVEMNWL